MEDTITQSAADLNEATAVTAPGPAPDTPADQGNKDASRIVNALAASESTTATLIIMEGPNSGSSIVLNKDEVVIGMHGERWLQLTRNGAGYCAIALDPTVLVLRNGSPLPPTPQLLEDGDAIGMSDFVMAFGCG